MVLVLALVAAIVLRFRHWMPAVFFGDDLAGLLSHEDGRFASSLRGVLLGAEGGKYRPVFTAIMWAAYAVFGRSLRAYLSLDIAVHATASVAVFALSSALSRSRLVGLLAALVVATSRFALYQVTQVTGLLEGSGFVFLLVMLLALSAAESRFEGLRVALALSVAVFAAFLAVNTHERYVVVLPWLAAVIATSPRTRELRLLVRSSLVAAPFAVLAANVLAKVVVVRVPFMVGTGGTRIQLDTAMVRDLAGQAVLSLLGVHAGPSYLAGEAPRPPFAAWASGCAAAFALGWAWRVGVPILSAIVSPERRSDLREPVCLLSLGALLLLPPIATIRLEQRWLVEPFTLILLVLSWAHGRDRHGTAPVRSTAPLVLGVLLAIDALLAPGAGTIFFVAEGRTASLLAAAIARDPPRAKYAIVRADGAFCGWTLQHGGFARLYAKGTALVCATPLAEPGIRAAHPDAPVYAWVGDGFSDVSRVRPADPAANRP